MTRTSTRLLAAAAIGASALGLAGCLSAMIPDAPSTPTSSAAPEPTKSTGGAEGADGSWSGGDLGFADGTRLASGTYIEWADGMAASDDYAVASPDDGNGNWSYTHVATQCVASFWQGRVSDFDLTAGDENLSDQVLAHDFGQEVSALTPYASDVQLALLGGSGVDMRAVSGSDETTSYVVVARGFAALGVALYLSLDCPTGQDAETVFSDVRDDVSVSVSPPR